VPFRLGASAEVAILTLARGDVAGISGAQSTDARTRGQTVR
jgi:hypothetical protein